MILGGQCKGGPWQVRTRMLRKPRLLIVKRRKWARPGANNHPNIALPKSDHTNMELQTVLIRWGQQPPNNHLQQSPQAKGEFARWGQQSPNNHLQESPQAKGELLRWGQQSPATITCNNHPRPRGNCRVTVRNRQLKGLRRKSCRTTAR